LRQNLRFSVKDHFPGFIDFSPRGQFAPWMFRPMYGLFAPWAIRPIDVSPHTRRFAPRANRLGAKRSVGRNVYGAKRRWANRPWGESPMGRNVHTWGETSMRRTVRGAKILTPFPDASFSYRICCLCYQATNSVPIKGLNGCEINSRL